MAEQSEISWTDGTFNPWRGCTKISPACTNCYAETQAKRNPKTLGVWGPQGTRVVGTKSYWAEPLKWDAKAGAEGRRLRIFCASLADVFEDWRGPLVDVKGERLFSSVDVNAGAIDGSHGATLDDARRDLFALMRRTPNLDWLVLTKRAENIKRMLPPDWGDGYPNVWLGVTVENQEYAEKRIPYLLDVPAAVRFISAEPLVGPIDLTRGKVLDLGGGVAAAMNFLAGGIWRKEGRVERWTQTEAGTTLDWVITGGESGAHARPGHPDWYRSLRDQCSAAGVPFHFKQHGEWKPISEMPSAEHEALYRPNRVAREHEDQSTLNDIYGRRCAVETRAVQYDGEDGYVSIDGHPGYRVFRVGKKAAGRLLDGKLWSEFPDIAARSAP